MNELYCNKKLLLYIINNIRDESIIKYLYELNISDLRNEKIYIYFNDKKTLVVFNNFYFNEILNIIQKYFNNKNVKIFFRFLDGNNIIPLEDQKNINSNIKIYDFFSTREKKFFDIFFKNDNNFAYIFGNFGSGKTFFIKWIIQKYNLEEVLFLNSYVFIQDIQNIFRMKKNESLQKIKNEIEQKHVVILDDIQIFSNKKHTTNFLVSIIEGLRNINNNCKIIFLSDRNYTEINQISYKLISYFEESQFMYFQNRSPRIYKKYIEEIFLANGIDNLNNKDFSYFLEVIKKNNIILNLRKINSIFNSFLLSLTNNFQPKEIEKRFSIFISIYNRKTSDKKNIYLKTGLWKEEIIKYLLKKNINIEILKKNKHKNEELEFYKMLIVFYLRKYVRLNFQEIGIFLDRDKSNVYKKYLKIINNKSKLDEFDKIINQNFFQYNK